VTIVNLGISFEAGGVFLGLSHLGKNQVTGGASASAAAVAAGLIGGKVLFNDNQVLLAPPAGGDDVISSSILIMTADDALVDGNQFECRLFTQNLLANGFIFGWSTRVNDNRFEERLALPGVSAMTWAAMNSTTDNQGTRCFLAIGIPALAVRAPNRSTLSLYLNDFCGDLSRTVTAALEGSGLDA